MTLVGGSDSSENRELKRWEGKVEQKMELKGKQVELAQDYWINHLACRLTNVGSQNVKILLSFI